ncbi:hypothetical protein LMG8526_0199 [Lactococcus lactis subsp. lactis]|nr:hypothetical protein LMG8526_0199 [Lactococcus lactis subsp. lactis]
MFKKNYLLLLVYQNPLFLTNSFKISQTSMENLIFFLAFISFID